MITPEAWTPVIIDSQCSSIKWIERFTKYVLPRIQVTHKKLCLCYFLTVSCPINAILASLNVLVSQLFNNYSSSPNDENSINSQHTKFLGVIIHQNLSWQAHIKAISSKIAKSTGIIIKSRQFFLSNTLCTLYNSLILPYLQYCSIIWASTYSSHLQPLFRLQKKVLRIITHSPTRAHTYSLFNKFKIVNLLNIYKYQVSCFVFLHMQKRDSMGWWLLRLSAKILLFYGYRLIFFSYG